MHDTLELFNQDNDEMLPCQRDCNVLEHALPRNSIYQKEVLLLHAGISLEYRSWSMHSTWVWPTNTNPDRQPKEIWSPMKYVDFLGEVRRYGDSDGASQVFPRLQTEPIEFPSYYCKYYLLLSHIGEAGWNRSLLPTSVHFEISFPTNL